MARSSAASSWRRRPAWLQSRSTRSVARAQRAGPRRLVGLRALPHGDVERVVLLRIVGPAAPLGRDGERLVAVDAGPLVDRLALEEHGAVALVGGLPLEQRTGQLDDLV